MKLNNPNLSLTFLGNDVLSPELEVSSDSIVSRSIAFSFQLLDGLKSSSNQVALMLAKDCAATEQIISTDGDIEAQLSDGEDILYTGFVSTSFSWAVTEHGEQALKITLEDRSTRLFAKPFISSGHHFFNSSADQAIRAVCASAGVSISSEAVSVPGTVTKLVDSSVSCRDILTDMLYELGYAFYCDNLGELRFFKIDCTSVSGLPVLDKTKLYSSGSDVVSLSKKIRQFRSVRMTFQALGTATDYLVYRNTTDQDESHPYCNLPLASGEHFDGLEIYTAQEWAEETVDEFREDALVEACNAASESSIVGSNKIISVSNIRMVAEKGIDITASIVAAGGPYLKINAENTGNSTQAISRLDAYGSIVFEKSTEVIRTGVGGVTTDSLYTEELSYIHTRELATRHANLVNQYQAYSNSLYTFYSKENLDCGALVRLHEDQYSGLDVNVLIIGKTVTDGSDVVRFSAVGISVFDLDKETYHQNTNTPGSDNKGSSAEVQYALGSSPTEPPSGDYSPTVPALIPGKYVWMRVRVGEGDWQYSRLTGEPGEPGDPAEVFDFSFGTGVFVRNLRLTTSQVVSIYPNVQNVSIVPTWACYVDGVLDNTLFDNVQAPSYLRIPFKNSYSEIKVIMSGFGVGAVERILAVVDETQDKGGMYIGELSALPATPWDSYITGDYFLAKETFTVSGNTYTEGVPYSYDGSSWFNELDITTAAGVRKAVNCFGGVLNSDVEVASTAALWGWFKNLVALNAVVRNFFAQNVTVGDGTGLAGSGFRFRAHAYDSDGVKLSTPLFDVMYGDKAVFKVEPSTGKIFFGDNFFYNPSDGAIHSTNDKVVIDSDGRLSTIDATVAGSITANAFQFDDIKMNWAYEEYSTPGTYYIDLYSDFGVAQGDLVVVSWGTCNEGFSKMNVISYIMQDDVKGLSYEYVLDSLQGASISYIRKPSVGVYWGIKIVAPNWVGEYSPIKVAVQAYHH